MYDNSTLTLTLFPTKAGRTSVFKVVGETFLTPKAEINVTKNSHLVIQMDETWVDTILAKLVNSSTQGQVELSNVVTWHIDESSSITLEGAFFDSQYGALTIHGGIDTYANIGNGKSG